MSVYKEGGVTKLTRYYLGNYEEEIVGTNVRKIHYLSGAILIQNNGVDSLLYTYSDAQGSLIVLTDADGNLLTKTINGVSTEIGRFAYDPWGARRDPNNWNVKDSRTSFIINRGYTGHEHLDAFGIINMNGRVYDPFTAQFFSPDPYVQAPGDWLNYNRYTYCYGNPFKYTDPSGNFIFSLFIPVVGVFLDAACWGAVLGGAGYTASVAFSSGGFSNWNSGAFWKSVGIGAISGAVTFGVGQAFGAVGSVAKGTFDIGKELARATVHGLAQGGLSVLGGGDFMQGFASGALGSFGGSLFQGVGGSFANSMAGTVGFSALSGGIGAELSGGDFWQGAATGATVGLLNHGAHLAQNEVEQHKNEIFLSKVEKVATTLGLSAETTAQLKEYAIGMAKIGRGAEAIEKIGKIAKLVGRASGVVGAGASIGKAFVNPTAPNVIAAIVNTALVGAGPITSIGSGVLDLTGVSDRFYNFLGNDLPSKAFDVYYNLNQNFNNTLNSLMVNP